MVFYIAVSQSTVRDVVEIQTTMLAEAQKKLMTAFKKYDDPRQYFRLYRVSQNGLTEVGIMGRLKGKLYWADGRNGGPYYPLKRDGTPNKKKPRTAGL